MGIRTDQFVGLCPAAEAFLTENEIKEKVCEHCKRPFPHDLKIIGHYVGMFEGEYPLYRHQLKDGTYADEFLQAAPWSSGPIHFLGLQITKCIEIEWTEEEINERST